MDRSKLVAIVTGAISLLLAIAYLAIVQLLDFRGQMVPAPPLQLPIIESIDSIQLSAIATDSPTLSGSMIN